mmetsp:Transcript_77555/g.225087  ORF Transcript_77555/g.225087 Transcript_77555/m.225087 type:complete len:349 (+) Transcript_77555:71-1117(+)
MCGPANSRPLTLPARRTGHAEMLLCQNSSSEKPKPRKPRAWSTKNFAKRFETSTAPEECTGKVPLTGALYGTSHSFAFFSGWNCDAYIGKPLRACTKDTNSLPRRSRFVANTSQKSRRTGLFAKSSVLTPMTCMCHVQGLFAASSFRCSGMPASKSFDGSGDVKFKGANIGMDSHPMDKGPGNSSPEEYSNACSKPRHVPQKGIRIFTTAWNTRSLKCPYLSRLSMLTPPPGKSTPLTRERISSTSSSGASKRKGTTRAPCDWTHFTYQATRKLPGTFDVALIARGSAKIAMTGPKKAPTGKGIAARTSVAAQAKGRNAKEKRRRMALARSAAELRSSPVVARLDDPA